MKKTLNILFLLTLFSFVSCEKDLYEDAIQKSHQKRISFSQFKSETKVKEFETLFRVPLTHNGAANRSAELSDFIIDTLAVQKYVSENNKTTYSFRIYSLATNVEIDEKYNLVYTKVDDNWEKTIIAFKERLNATASENQYEEFVKIYDTRIPNTTSSAISEVCFTETYLFHCTNTGQCRDTGVCDGCYLCVTRVVSVNFCGSSGGGITNPETGSGSNPGDAGYIPLDPFEFSPNLFDNPVYDNVDYINACKANHFFSNLSDGQKLWVGQHLNSYFQLVNNMIANNWSPESVSFGNSLINVCSQNNSSFTFDNTITPENSTIFGSIDEMNNFINNVSLQETVLANSTNDYIGSYKFKIGTLGLGGVKVLVKFNQNGTNPMTVEDVNSEQYGTMFGTWTQSTYTANTLSNDKIKIDIFGNLLVDMTVGGFGIKNNIPYHLTLVVDAITSGVESSSWSNN